MILTPATMVDSVSRTVSICLPVCVQSASLEGRVIFLLMLVLITSARMELLVLQQMEHVIFTSVNVHHVILESSVKTSVMPVRITSAKVAPPVVQIIPVCPTAVSVHHALTGLSVRMQ